MKPVTRLYLRMILSFIFFFALVTIFFDLFRGKQFSLFSFDFFFTSVFPSLLISFFLVPEHLRSLRKLGLTEFTDRNLSPYQNDEVESNISKEDLIEKLKNNKLARIMNIEGFQNSIVLKPNRRFGYAKDVIRIIIKEQEEGRNQYLISSRPKLRSRLIDNGTNFKNIQTIKKIIGVN